MRAGLGREAYTDGLAATEAAYGEGASCGENTQPLSLPHLTVQVTRYIQPYVSVLRELRNHGGNLPRAGMANQSDSLWRLAPTLRRYDGLKFGIVIEREALVGQDIDVRRCRRRDENRIINHQLNRDMHPAIYVTAHRSRRGI